MSVFRRKLCDDEIEQILKNFIPSDDESVLDDSDADPNYTETTSTGSRHIVISYSSSNSEDDVPLNKINSNRTSVVDSTAGSMTLHSENVSDLNNVNI